MAITYKVYIQIEEHDDEYDETNTSEAPTLIRECLTYEEANDVLEKIVGEFA